MNDALLGGLLDVLDTDGWAVEIQCDSGGYHVRLSMDDVTAFRCVAKDRLAAVECARRWAGEHGADWLDLEERLMTPRTPPARVVPETGLQEDTK